MDSSQQTKLLKSLTITGLKSLLEYVQNRIVFQQNNMEQSSQEDFKGFQGRLKELRVLEKEIKFLIKK